MWIDTHCHLDAPELGLWPPADAFGAENGPQNQKNHENMPFVQHPRHLFAIQSIAFGLIPAVELANFHAVRSSAHSMQWGYALGIHPLYVAGAAESDLGVMDAALTAHAADPRLLAVGEIGLDFWVPALKTEPLLTKQGHFYREQLKLARKHGLPAVLHVRRSADMLLKHLRQIGVKGGIAHAFNGSVQQAHAFIDLGFKLGFGGAMTFPAATQLRLLATRLPLESLVLETDSPDIPPQWLYKTAAQRAAGERTEPNTPAQLPRIAQVLADLRGIGVDELRQATCANACAALPRLPGLLVIQK